MAGPDPKDGELPSDADAVPALPTGDNDIVRGPAAAETERFVRVGTTDDPFEADLIADALDEAGIPVLARARRVAPVETLVVPSAPWWEVLVPEKHLERATEIFSGKQAELESQAEAAGRAAEEEEAATEPKDS